MVNWISLILKRWEWKWKWKRRLNKKMNDWEWTSEIFDYSAVFMCSWNVKTHSGGKREIWWKGSSKYTHTHTQTFIYSYTHTLILIMSKWSRLQWTMSDTTTAHISCGNMHELTLSQQWPHWISMSITMCSLSTSFQVVSFQIENQNTRKKNS